MTCKHHKCSQSSLGASFLFYFLLCLVLMVHGSTTMSAKVCSVLIWEKWGGVSVGGSGLVGFGWIPTVTAFFFFLFSFFFNFIFYFLFYFYFFNGFSPCIFKIFNQILITVCSGWAHVGVKHWLRKFFSKCR